MSKIASVCPNRWVWGMYTYWKSYTEAQGGGVIWLRYLPSPRRPIATVDEQICCSVHDGLSAPPGPVAEDHTASHVVFWFSKDSSGAFRRISADVSFAVRQPRQTAIR